MRNTSVLAVVIVGSFATCCGFSALLGQSQRVEREHAERQQEATGEAQATAAHTDPQAEAARASSAKPSATPWQDPAVVAGEEAGMAAGLPYARIFELGYQVWKAGQAGSADPVLTVAEQEGIAAGTVEDAMVTYNELRPAMAKHLGRVLGSGVTGRVEVSGVGPESLGPFTARTVVTVTGCPERTAMAWCAPRSLRTPVWGRKP